MEGIAEDEIDYQTLDERLREEEEEDEEVPRGSNKYSLLKNK